MRFLGALKTNYPNFYVLALTQIGFGLRIGESLGLSWEDLDLKNRVANIRRNIAWDREKQELFEKKRKNGKVLEVAIPEFLALELEKLRGNRSGYVFHRNGELLKRQQVAKAYNRVLSDLGITYVKGTHMLRKTAGILARKLTRDVYAASKLLDHSSVSITEKYYQEQLDEDKRMVAAALDGVLKSSWPPVAPKTNLKKLTLIKTVG